jgi:hypothetical protein
MSDVDMTGVSKHTPAARTWQAQIGIAASYFALHESRPHSSRDYAPLLAPWALGTLIERAAREHIMARQMRGGITVAVEDLRKNDMMAHLLDALEAGQDIGHYGRLVFAMVARHFMSEDELLTYLQKNPNFSAEEARALYHQVQGHDYNPPRRERILEWQKSQEFPICPNPDDPDACNVYKDLQFPESIYQNITDYHEQKAKD